MSNIKSHSTVSSTAKNEVELRVDAVDDLRLDALEEHKISLRQILKAHPVPKFSPARIRLYVTICCLYLVATCSGFDGSLMTSINTLDEYKEWFNLPESASGTGLIFSIYTIGSMASTCLVWLGDYIGRVYTIGIGLVIVVIGSIISATTANHKAFIAARFILSFGVTLATTSTPAYLLEVVPSDMKTLALFYNTLYFVGSLIATWTMYGTEIHYKGTHKSFSIALWLQILCPCIILSMLWLFPESPRYLYSKNKVEKSKAFVVKYHAGGDENHPIVAAEMKQIAESFAQSGFLKPRDYLDFTVLIRTKARQKRTLLVVIWSWFSQFSGNQVITYYMTTLLLNLGVENATTRLLLTAVNSIVCLIFASFGVFTIERFGRRPILLYACAGFILCFAVLAGTTKAFEADNNNHVASRVGIAFIYIFQAVFFAFAFTPLQPTYPAEVFSNDMRARGMALWHLVSNAAGTVNLYTAPIAMANIKYWYYVFFCFWDAIELLVIYFFFVETSQLSLEEIEYIFTQPNSVKESIRLSNAARSGDTEVVKELFAHIDPVTSLDA
ncbi:hypothetical protein PSN45_002341 [Yamadazyma tenuis]|uniref:Putative lactose permease n=1 Tax=Candida tenuis (strain ATCC 10573 / BCRC 21748 / CBS 615 / JCM 9827 / NBRC 10315 / NRRL Y-1498 / VKM Y-70) TaxID=590646 RepID=G3BEN1_CANTC|nr:putative lactose permease [Yamadazyma tenuis ATCC 10573]EGV59932.1 putative lactose permease [Yamadazyma tenuis ATCC 10573]WEJ94841.1 hypothetical protein PSN45_002341 [Yamadazyma tenuis]